MVGGFSTNHAVRSGTNLQLCSRCLILVIHASGISIQWVWKSDDIVNFFCMRLISQRYQENCVWNGLKCHTSRPPNPWVARLSPKPFTGYGVEMNDSLGCVWTLTFIWGLIKEVHRENTFSFCGSVGKDITSKPLVFPWSGVSSGLVTYIIVARNQRKR